MAIRKVVLSHLDNIIIILIWHPAFSLLLPWPKKKANVTISRFRTERKERKERKERNLLWIESWFFSPLFSFPPHLSRSSDQQRYLLRTPIQITCSTTKCNVRDTHAITSLTDKTIRPIDLPFLYQDNPTQSGFFFIAFWSKREREREREGQCLCCLYTP